MARFDLSKLRDRLPSGSGASPKMPKWAASAWSDLSNGPLRWVAVALVALIAAVPVVLARGGSETDAPVVAQSAGDPVSSEVLKNAEASEQALGTPGKGVGGEMSNPFAAPTPTPGAGGGGGTPASPPTASPGGSGGGETPKPASPGGGSSPSPADTPTSSAPKPAPNYSTPRTSVKPRWYYLAADVSLKAGGETTKRTARPAGLLPSTEAPVLVYVGASTDRRYATFMPAPGTVVDSGAKCRPTPEQCWFIRVRRGRTVRLRVLAGTLGETPVALKVTDIERKRVGSKAPRAGASLSRSR